jgi:hypothetical protein
MPSQEVLREGTNVHAQLEFHVSISYEQKKRSSRGKRRFPSTRLGRQAGKGRGKKTGILKKKNLIHISTLPPPSFKGERRVQNVSSRKSVGLAAEMLVNLNAPCQARRLASCLSCFPTKA